VNFCPLSLLIVLGFRLCKGGTEEATARNVSLPPKEKLLKRSNIFSQKQEKDVLPGINWLPLSLHFGEKLNSGGLTPGKKR
jgi:hypothetical protein